MLTHNAKLVFHCINVYKILVEETLHHVFWYKGTDDRRNMLPPLPTLKMEAVGSSEISVPFYQTAYCHIFIFTAITTTNPTNLSSSDALLNNVLIHQLLG
jgi:hypothetical protein